MFEHFQDQALPSMVSRSVAPAARTSPLHVIDEVVDDVVVRIRCRALGGSGGFLWARNVEADDGGVETFRQRHVGFA